MIAFVIMAVVLGLSLGPEPPLESLPFGDNVPHAIAYVGLSSSYLLAAVWAPVRGPGRWPSAASPILLGLAGFGIGLEILQGFTERTPDHVDALTNTAGVAIGAVGWLLLRRRLDV